LTNVRSAYYSQLELTRGVESSLRVGLKSAELFNCELFIESDRTFYK